jgi:parvulin-like peptidyl-prolyl isomerase
MTVAPACETVGWVMGEPVTLEMLARYLEEHTPPAAVGDDPAARNRWAARAVMTAMLGRREAARRGLAHERELPAAVAAELVGEGTVSPSETEAYFERNRPRYERAERRRARHVLCATEQQAHLVAERARSGEPFSALAEQFSADPGSRGRGGDLGWLRRGELAGEIEELLFAADVGQIVGPVRSPFGWHVLVVDAMEPAGAADFASVREAIEAELAGRRSREAYADWLERQALAGIRMAPGYEHPFRRTFLEWAHRH